MKEIPCLVSHIISAQGRCCFSVGFFCLHSLHFHVQAKGLPLASRIAASALPGSSTSRPPGKDMPGSGRRGDS